MTEATPQPARIPPSSMRRSRFTLALAGVAIVIIYGSLYPFTFSFHPTRHGAVYTLLSTWSQQSSFGDMLANVVLYLPFGFCAVLSFRAALWLRVLAAITAGIALSVCMELCQVHIWVRLPSMADVRSNAAGTLLGVAGGLAFEQIWKGCRGLPVRLKPYLLLLLACWAGYRLFPYEPVVDLHKYWHALEPLIKPQLSAVALLRHMAAWLAVALMLDELLGAALARAVLPVLLLAVLLARVLIDGAVLSASEVAGGVLAVVLWAAWLWRAGSRGRWISCLFVLSLLLQGLEPFHFAVAGQRFGWIPFHGLIEGEPRIAVPSFFEKAFDYGTLLWLLNRCFRLSTSMAIGSALVMTISLVHVYIPSVPAEITDVALLLSMAVVLQLAGARRTHEKLSIANTRR